MRAIKTILASAVIGVWSAGAVAAPIIVDDFSTGSDNGFQQIPGFIPDSGQVGGGGILGGFRDVQVGGNATGFVGTRATASGGVFAFSNDTGVTGDVLITWDGDDSPTVLDPLGLGGVDLTSGGFNDAFRLDVLTSDLAGLQLTIHVHTDAGNSSSQSITIGTAVNGGLMQDFLFTNFTPTAGGGADFANVGAIQLYVTGPAEIDATFDLVGVLDTTPVPVPASLPLMVAGLAGVALVSRSRR